MKFLLYSFLGLMFFASSGIYAQDKTDFQEQYSKEYKQRIQKEYLFRTYIPKDLFDAFKQLNKLTDEKSTAKFKSAPEDVVVKKLHFSLGRWMIHNWQFYEGSRFSHYLKGMGLSYPDDMASFVIRTYHRKLNNKPLGIADLVKEIEEKIKLQNKELIENASNVETIEKN